MKLQKKKTKEKKRKTLSQNFPLAIERDSADADSTIEDSILLYKSDFIFHNSTLHVPFYDRSQSNLILKKNCA